jgi:hypothetical protein
MINGRKIKRVPLLKDIRRKAREENLDPADMKFYPSKKPPVLKGAVSKGHNALSVPSRRHYDLVKFGQPFLYQGALTRRYHAKSILALFGIDRSTLTRWSQRGTFPPAFMSVENSDGGSPRLYWLLYQVKPVYIWTEHLKARGLKVVQASDKDRKYLQEQLTRAERKWLKRLGEDYADPYTKAAGKYGVIWNTD